MEVRLGLHVIQYEAVRDSSKSGLTMFGDKFSE